MTKLSTNPKPIKGTPLCRQTRFEIYSSRIIVGFLKNDWLWLPIRSWLNVGVSTGAGQVSEKKRHFNNTHNKCIRNKIKFMVNNRFWI